jgi:hypothetical protein
MLRAFFSIIEKWEVRGEDACILLGGISNEDFYSLKKNPDQTLDPEAVTRVTYLAGIYIALHTLYGDELADKWVQMPNQNAIFGGQTPLGYMIRGGLPAFPTMLHLLDARRGGV